MHLLASDSFHILPDDETINNNHIVIPQKSRIGQHYKSYHQHDSVHSKRDLDLLTCDIGSGIMIFCVPPLRFKKQRLLILEFLKVWQNFNVNKFRPCGPSTITTAIKGLLIYLKHFMCRSRKKNSFHLFPYVVMKYRFYYIYGKKG
ncbi:hypothetical protein BD770DRAFT_411060 [Pilaira anomala]|nr:hypothetical protein BD770DRAFT_411060 [Pilaira anomala]